MSRAPQTQTEKIEMLRDVGALATVLVVLWHSRAVGLRLSLGQGTLDAPTWLRAVENLLHWPGLALHVPIFFLTSGYLFFRAGIPTVAGYRRKIADRFGGLVVPYLLWNAALLFGLLVLQSDPRLSHVLTRTEPVRGLADAAWKVTGDPIVYQFWFLRELILLSLLSPLVGLAVRSRAAALWLALGAVGFVYSLSLGEVLSARGAFFFALGAALATRDLPLRLRVPRCAPAVYAGVVATTASLRLPYSAWWIAAEVLVGIVILFGLYDPQSAFWKGPAIRAVRKHAFFVFAFHEPLLTVVRKGFLYLVGTSGPLLALEIVLAPTAAIAVCVFVGEEASRRLPRLYAVLTGGRVPMDRAVVRLQVVAGGLREREEARLAA